MSEANKDNGGGTAVATPPAPRQSATVKELRADSPTWCPGCGDFAVLSTYYKLCEKRAIPHEKITSVAGIGCSSRFPYFVNAHGAHFIHGRAIPFATGLSLSRPDLHVFTFSGDGDNFSIGGNHIDHVARKNVKMTLVVMDNGVYGLTKAQTSPTSPIGFKSKTDPTGAMDQPINPMKKLVAAGASFIARTHAGVPAHMIEIMEKAMDHNGFSVIECLSECIEFYGGAFDAAHPRKGGQFQLVPPDHDVTDEIGAYKLAQAPFPGYFGIFYKVQRATKNANEQKLIDTARTATKNAPPLALLQKTFDRMK